MLSLRRIPVFLLAATLLVAACGGELSPFEPEINSATDTFQFQATGVTGVTLTRTFTWTNTGTRATVNHSTTTTQGSAQLTIRDATNAVVYDKPLVASLNEPTVSGAAGGWKVEVRLTNYAGTMNFRVQKL